MTALRILSAMLPLGALGACRPTSPTIINVVIVTPGTSLELVDGLATVTRGARVAADDALATAMKRGTDEVLAWTLPALEGYAARLRPRVALSD